MFDRLLTTALLLLAGLTGCRAAPPDLRRAEFTRLCMGVPTRIVVYTESEESARDSAAAAFGRIADLEQVMSDYRPDSELMRLCAAPAGAPVPISPDLHDVLKTSQRLAAASDGAFDITLGPAVALWRRARATQRLPAPEELTAARDLTGPHLLAVHDSPPSATLARPGMKLDLGGIGKGYAAQAAADLLRSRGHPRCLVALAGDVVTGEPPPGATGWRIELPFPEGAGRGLGRIVLANAAVSTSGSTEQYVEMDGRRYAHILDPRTGLGLTEFRLATVTAPRGELSDALATVACIVPAGGLPAILAEFPGSRLVGPASLDASVPRASMPSAVLAPRAQAPELRPGPVPASLPVP